MGGRKKEVGGAGALGWGKASPPRGMLRGRGRSAGWAAGRRGFQAGGTTAAEPLREKGVQRSGRRPAGGRQSWAHPPAPACCLSGGAPNSTPGPLPHLGGSLSKPPGNGDGSHATASTARVPTREGAREDALDDGAGLGWAGLPGARRAGPRGLEREGRELGHRGLL